MKAVVDRDLCIGCGACEDVCPDVFRLEDDGIAIAIVEHAGPLLWDCVRDATDSCPVEAISVETSAGLD